jgi:hypothetical protein
VEEDPDEKRYLELVRQMLAAYGLIRHMLVQLPIPIRLPEIEEGWDPDTVLMAVERCRTELIKDQPIGGLHQGLLKRVVLEWLTVYEIGGLVRVAGPTGWRFDAMHYGLRRLVILATQVADALDMDLEPPLSE